MFAFQQRQASLKCCKIVRDLFAFTPCVRETRDRGRGDGVDAAVVPCLTETPSWE